MTLPELIADMRDKKHAQWSRFLAGQLELYADDLSNGMPFMDVASGLRVQAHSCDILGRPDVADTLRDYAFKLEGIIP